MEINTVIKAAAFVGGLVASTGAATLAKEGAKIIIENSEMLSQNETMATVCEWSAGIIAGAAANWAINQKANAWKNLVTAIDEAVKESTEKEESKEAEAKPVMVEAEVVN